MHTLMENNFGATQLAAACQVFYFFFFFVFYLFIVL